MHKPNKIQTQIPERVLLWSRLVDLKIYTEKVKIQNVKIVEKE